MPSTPSAKWGVSKMQSQASPPSRALPGHLLSCSCSSDAKWERSHGPSAFGFSLHSSGASLLAQRVKNLPAMWDAWFGKILWRSEWQPTPVFLPRKSHGQRRLGGYSPWGRRVGHHWVTDTFHSAVQWTHTHTHFGVLWAVVGRQGGPECAGCLMDASLAAPSRLSWSLPSPEPCRGRLTLFPSALPGACQRPFQFQGLWRLPAQHLCLIVTWGLLSPTAPHSWNVKVRSLEQRNPISLSQMPYIRDLWSVNSLFSLVSFFPSLGKSLPSSLYSLGWS